MWQRDGRNIRVDEELTLTIRYTEPGSASKGIRLDHEVMPLIETAPQLLDALKGLCSIATHPKATKAAIRMIAEEAWAVIAKAEGK